MVSLFKQKIKSNINVYYYLHEQIPATIRVSNIAGMIRKGWKSEQDKSKLKM